MKLGYKKGESKIPAELIEKIQEYVDGTTVYIPKKSKRLRRCEGNDTNHSAIEKRNAEIYSKYILGTSVKELSKTYYISPQGIYKILSKFKH